MSVKGMMEFKSLFGKDLSNVCFRHESSMDAKTREKTDDK